MNVRTSFAARFPALSHRANHWHRRPPELPRSNFKMRSQRCANRILCVTNTDVRPVRSGAVRRAGRRSGRRSGSPGCRSVRPPARLQVSHQCPGQYHPLLLPSGKLTGAMRSAVAQSDFFEPLHSRRTGRLPGFTPDQQRHHDVLERRELRQQVVNLPNEPNLAVAKVGETVLVEVGDIQFSVQDTAGGRSVQTAQQVEKVDLPAPDSPITATRSPWLTARFKPSNTANSLSPERYRLVRSTVRIPPTASESKARATPLVRLYLG